MNKIINTKWSMVTWRKRQHLDILEHIRHSLTFINIIFHSLFIFFSIFIFTNIGMFFCRLLKLSYNSCNKLNLFYIVSCITLFTKIKILQEIIIISITFFASVLILVRLFVFSTGFGNVDRWSVALI